MDFTGTKPLIISCGVGGWYPAGIDRLEKSLIHHGYAGDMLFWRNEYPPHSPSHQENPYAFKIYAFREAFNRGYSKVMWLDCSFWNVKNCHHLFDIIIDKGNFAFRSGYNLGQTCPDNLLEYVGITRDQAWERPETATGIVGINYDNPEGKAVFDYWAEMCDLGYFKNSRNHNPEESQDPRFLFGRQDQSAYGMALYKAGVSFLYQDYVAYYNGGNPGYDKDKCVFFISGL